jgi:hypothetical protein
MVRSRLNDDIKQAICKLNYLGMTVGEVLCSYHHAFSLEEVATLNAWEQCALLDVGTALAALFKWRASAVHQEMQQLFKMAASGSRTGDVGAQGTALLCPSTGNVQAATDIEECAPGLSSKANFLAQDFLAQDFLAQDFLAKETDVTKRIQDLKNALSMNLISEECVDKVLHALWESRELATASTCCAATAVMEMEAMAMPPPPAAISRSGRRTCRNRNFAAAAADPSADEAQESPSKEHLAARAAKRFVRDVFLWRTAGELGGFDSRLAMDELIRKYRFSDKSKAQVLNGFTSLSSSMNIKLQQCKKNLKNAEVPSVAFSDLTGPEPVAPPVGLPPGLDLPACCTAVAAAVPA